VERVLTDIDADNGKRAPRLWRPLPASIAGAGQEHGRTIPFAEARFSV
jgi:hypothetical protein